MGPLILARALGGEVPYAVKIHGSALEYTVKPHPRFMPFAPRGSAARAACSSARATPRRACGRRWPSRSWRRARGSARPASTSAFAPREPAAAAAGLAALAERLGARRRRRPAGSLVRPRPGRGGRRARARSIRARPDRGLRRQADRLQGRRAAARGVAARARARARRPAAGRRLRAFRDGLEELAGALARGRPRRRAAPLRARGRAGAARSSRRSSTRSTPSAAPHRRRATAGDGALGGPARARGAHRRAARRARPSRCRARSPRRSAWSPPRPPPAGRSRSSPATPGMAEVARALAEAVPREARPWLTFEVGPGAVEELAARPRRLARRRRRKCARATREAIVERRPRALLVGRRRAHRDRRRAQGELDGLPPPVAAACPPGIARDASPAVACRRMREDGSVSRSPRSRDRRGRSALAGLRPATTATTSSPARSCSSQKCGCVPHARARRRHRASSGPNLDEAFQQADRTASAARPSRAWSTGRSCIPNRNAQIDPQTGKP